MNTDRLLAAYLEGLAARLVKVLGGLTVLYVLGVFWNETQGLEKPIDVAAIVASLVENVPILLGVLGLGVLYSVIKPAFRPSDRTALSRGEDPGEVPTAIKIGENPAVYLLQTVVRALFLVPLAVGLVAAFAYFDSGNSLTVTGALSAVTTDQLGTVLIALGLALFMALVWPYADRTSSTSGSAGGGGDVDGE